MLEEMNKIIEFFKNKKVVVAISGGLDSTVLFELAKKSAEKSLGIIVKTAFLHEHEFQNALDYLNNQNNDFRIVEADLFKHPRITENDRNRCYYCKKAIFSSIIDSIKDYDYGFIVDGSNFSDLSDYRPGIRALEELGIKSPFIEFKITKNTIRQMAKHLNLDVANKPATTCLATRIPYNSTISVDKLARIEKAEKIIRNLVNVNNLRVRDHDTIARIEVAEEDLEILLRRDIRTKINEELKKIGYLYVAIDIEGYKQGSLNQTIRRK